MISCSLVIIGLAFVPDPATSVIGFFVFILGITGVGSIMGMFRGLPYQPNPGWHADGDPDVIATMTQGRPPSSFTMSDVDRALTEEENAKKND